MIVGILSKNAVAYDYTEPYPSTNRAEPWYDMVMPQDIPPEFPPQDQLTSPTPLAPSPTTSFDTKGFTFTVKVALAIITIFYAAKLGVYGATKVVAHMQKESTRNAKSLTTAQRKIPTIKEDVSQENIPQEKIVAQQPSQLPTPTQKTTVPQESPITPRAVVASIAKEVPRTDIRAVIATAEKAIVANLETMTIDLYANGLPLKTFPIASKGRPNSHWETPSGIYEILTKERTHFSSIGEVNMPYSMQFYGNFFIHGWPTYKDGTPVEQNYSGGCIRMATNDAAQIYEFAKLHTPLIVIDKSDAKAFAEALRPYPALSDTAIEVKKSIIQNLGELPRMSAKAYLVADLESGEIIAASNADSKLPIASITKLMTAIVSNETIRYDATIKVTPEALATYGDSGGLVLGEKINATDMLYPLLMESSNDAAEALARSYGRTAFITQMNKKAAALGMTTSTFDDPSGISANNQASAYDLFSLARYLYEKKQFLLSITRTATRKLTTDATTHALRNFNVFSGDSAFLGGKTGFTTAAQETMVALFSVDTTSGNRPIAIIVLGSKDRARDTSSLLTWTREATKVPDAFASGASLGATVSSADAIQNINTAEE